MIIKDGDITQDTTDRVEELREQQERTTAKHERDFINERIASLVGGIGCIYVGAISDIEQKEKFDRVDDSVCAVRSALQEGIVPGGGVLLNSLSKDYSKDTPAHKIIKQTLEAPLIQILKNAGLDKDIVYKKKLKKDQGYNVVTGKYGNMFEMGVVDPTKVATEALSNAISVATTILTTNAIITHARANGE